MSLLIVGVIAFDHIETPFGKSEKMLGGPVTFSALAASHFNIKIDVISVVGGDFGDQNLQLLNNQNISTKNIMVYPDEKTFFWAGKYHNDMNSRDTLATDLNVYQNYTPTVSKELNPTILLLGNDHPKNQLEVINQLTNRPKLIVLDTMNYWMDNFWDELIHVINEVDIITINDSEARQLSGEYSLVKAAKKILQMGPQFLIIKKGEHGALLFSKEEVFFAPALPLEEVFDPTGAGDTFAGGFVGYLTKTQDFSFENLKRAVIYGSAMASFCVEKFGPERLFELNKDSFNRRIKAFERLTNYQIKI
ncbi:adenosine kinase [Flavobacteriaceae bacterium UJ101]|nr:adenosine kinase [Flavobacteriaceae bacterium UJ101]